jgi:predicted ester cyclase
MSIEENKALVGRYHEELWKGDESIMDELLAPDFNKPNGFTPEQLKQTLRETREACPDLTFKIEEVIAEGDKVALRWTVQGTHQGTLPGPYGPITPTGKHIISTGITINRLENGKIVEDRFESSDFSLYQQLGAIPTPTPN